jgi:hypothetical protein
MFVLRAILAIALFLGFVDQPAYAQQLPISVADGVTVISPTDKCSAGTIRRTQVLGQQVGQQGFGYTIHYCEPADRVLPVSATALREPADQRAWPTLIPISQFGMPNEHNDFTPKQISSQELSLLQSSVGAISFADYRQSGCHDRAHAAFLLLPEPLRAKAGKLWVVAPSRYTRGVRGTITAKADRDVDWGYHVALAFMTADGVKLFDPTLSPGRLLSESQWLDSFDYPALTFRVFSDPSVYLFYNEHQEVATMNSNYGYIPNLRIWTGNSFPYDGDARKENWIPNALARDAVGALVEDGRACEPLRRFRKQPGDLLSALQAGGLPSSCDSEARLFTTTRDRWIARLN